MLSYILLGLVAAILALAVYVRVAPLDPERWHRPPPVAEAGTHTTQSSALVIRNVQGQDAVLTALDEVILATPRTRRLAGSPEEGMVTYVTRSRLWGFPDLTTVAVNDGVLRVFGRLRFGKADLGVNAARVTGWVDAVAPEHSEAGQ